MFLGNGDIHIKRCHYYIFEVTQGQSMLAINLHFWVQGTVHLMYIQCVVVSFHSSNLELLSNHFEIRITLRL